ncbi:MAG: hypothetical protein ABIG42_08605, partial [bacterium]
NAAEESVAFSNAMFEQISPLRPSSKTRRDFGRDDNIPAFEVFQQPRLIGCTESVLISIH